MKKMRIILLILVGILVLGCAGIAVLFFTTDVFKTNQQIFVKSISKVNIFELANTEGMAQYLKKTETNKYEDEGSLSLSVKQYDETVLEDFTIAFESKNDFPNKLSESKIKLNNSGQEILNMTTLRNDDLYGITIGDVLDKYLVLENKNLKELATKLGITDTSSVPDKFDEASATEIIDYINANQQAILKKYSTVIFEKIPKERYTKASNNETTVDGAIVKANGYVLTLTEKDLYNVLKKVYETAKEDKVIYELINKASETTYTFEDYQSTIDDMLDELEYVEPDDSKIMTITVYNKAGKTIKIEFSISKGQSSLEFSMEFVENKTVLNFSAKQKDSYDYTEESNMKITSTKTTNGKILDMTMEVIEDEEKTGQFTMQLKREGNLDSDNIKYDLTLNYLAEDMEMNLTGTEKTNFVSEIEIPKFQEGNYTILNNLSAEEIQLTLLDAVQKLSTKLGLDSYLSALYNFTSTKALDNTYYDEYDMSDYEFNYDDYDMSDYEFNYDDVEMPDGYELPD